MLEVGRDVCRFFSSLLKPGSTRAMSSSIFKMSKHGDSTISLGNLMQSSITLTVRKCEVVFCFFFFSLMFKENLFVFHFVPIAPSSFIWCTTEKSLALSLLSFPPPHQVFAHTDKILPKPSHLWDEQAQFSQHLLI